MPNYDPSGWSQLITKPKKQETWPIGDDLTAFESMIPGQSAVSGELFQSLLKGLQGQFPEEYFQQSIDGPMKEEFESYLAPSIREEFAGPGTYWGTGRTAAVGRGRNRLADAIAAKRSEMAMTTQNQALQAALAYLGTNLMATYQPFKKDEGKKPKEYWEWIGGQYQNVGANPAMMI